jgi:hypothetical protein
MPESNRKSLVKKIFWAIGIIVTLLILYGFIKVIIREWHTIRSAEWHLNIWLFVASLLICALSFILNAKVYHRLIKAFGGKVPFKKFCFIFLASNLGKYAPGRIVQLASLLVFMRREGVRNSVTLSAMAIFQALLTTMGAVVGIVFAGPEIVHKISPEFPVPVLYIFAAIVLLATLPRFFEPILNFLLKLMKREPVEYNLSIRDWAVAIIVFSIYWIFIGASFALMTASISNVELWQVPYIGGSFLIAYIGGWIILFAPGGIGVREGILMVLLKTFFATGIAGIIAAAARIWILVAEVLSLGIAFAIYKLFGKPLRETA